MGPLMLCVLAVCAQQLPFGSMPIGGFGGGTGPALVAHTSIAINSASTDVTSAVNTTGGTILWAVGSAYNITSISLADSKSNTWTLAGGAQSTHDGFASAAWYCLAPTVGTGHTFTLSGGNYYSLTVFAFSGVTTLDQANHTYLTPAVSGTMQPGSITPTSNGQLIVVGAATAVGPMSVSLPTFTLTDHSELNNATIAAYLIQSTAAAINPTISGVYPGAYDSAAWVLSFR